MSTIVIKIDDIDITDDVFIRESSFTSLVNGQPGPSTIRVKDVAQTYDFISGGTLTLDIDGSRVWGGYVVRALKNYLLVQNTTDPGSLTRVWSITGVDYNILFNKRIIYQLDDPSNKVSWDYDADTYDDTIINDIFDNYLEIGADGLTRTGVQRIAKAILDVPGKVHKGSVASAGFTWKQMMDRIARATGGVYYISPEKDLSYVDVETATSAYELTDTPTTVSSVGFQSFALMDDGTKLVNDMFVWGSALGSDHIVFSRSTDASSVAEHGRRQLALFSGGLYRQASTDIVADSYVYGTPQSHRGGKDPNVTFTARVFEPVFRAGQTVDVNVGIYGYSDVLPIRSMKTTFATPTDPIFDLVLGHEIDEPVGIFEWRNTPFDPGRDPGDDDPPEPGDPGGDPSCSDAVCGITDGYGRTVADGLDKADCGIAYQNIDAGAWSVVPGTATVVDPGGNSPFAVLPFAGIAAPSDVYWRAQVTASGTPSTGDFIGFGADTEPDFAEVDFSTDGSLVLYTNGPGENSTTMPFGPDQEFKVRLNAGGTNARVKVWLATDPEPSGWTLEQPFDIPATVWDLDLYYGVVADDSNVTAEFTYLNAPGLNRCVTPQIDDFKREVFDGTWGTASDGQDWTNLAAPNVFVAFAADQTFGQISFDTTSGSDLNAIQTLTVAPTPDIPDGPIDVYMDFYADVVPAEVNSLTSSFFLALLSDIFTNITVNLVYEQSGDITIGVVYQNSNADGGGSSTEVVSSSLQGNWLRVRMQLTAGAVKAKAWPRGFAEPSGWNVVSDSDFTAQMLADFVGGGIDFQVGYSMFLDLQSSGGYYNVRVSNIDLKYPGSPCYQIGLTCFNDTLDGFDRTESGGWGTTEQFDLPWIVSDTALASVTGNEAVMTLPNGSSESARVSSPYLWAFDFNVQTRFSIDAIPEVGYGFSPLAEYGFGVHSTGFGGEMLLGKVQISPTDGPLTPPLQWSRIQGLGGYTDIPSSFWNGGSLYVLEIAVVGTGCIASVWDLSDPGTVYSTPSGTVYGGRSGDLILNMSNFGTPTDNEIVVSYVELATCYAPPPAGGDSGLPATGRVCETVSHSGGTDFTASRAYFLGSLETWVNGLRVAPATQIGTSGDFTLTDSLDSSDWLHICYRANGDYI